MNTVWDSFPETVLKLKPVLRIFLYFFRCASAKIFLTKLIKSDFFIKYITLRFYLVCFRKVKNNFRIQNLFLKIFR